MHTLQVDCDGGAGDMRHMQTAGKAGAAAADLQGDGGAEPRAGGPHAGDLRPRGPIQFNFNSILIPF